MCFYFISASFNTKNIFNSYYILATHTKKKKKPVSSSSMKNVMGINSPAEYIMFCYSRDSRDKYLTQLAWIKLSRQQYAHSSKTLNRKNLAAVKEFQTCFFIFQIGRIRLRLGSLPIQTYNIFLIVITPSL